MDQKSAIVFLLKTQVGFEISLFDFLSIGQVGDKFYVKDNIKHVFVKAEDAVDFFLDVRQDKMLGFDHEDHNHLHHHYFHKRHKYELGGEG